MPLTVDDVHRTMTEIIEELQERLDRAKEESAESASAAPNSYGAGSDWGEWWALHQLQCFIFDKE